MMSPDLRVLSGVDGLPPLPDTEYLLCYDPSSNNELAGDLSDDGELP